MWYSESRDALVMIDKQPVWVRVSAVDAVYPDAHPNEHRTRILLRGGRDVVTDKSVDEVVDALSKAMTPPKSPL